MTDGANQDLEERAHELYWSSESSVNALAGTLGVSKSRLYQLIRPLAADRPCAECGGSTVYEHRTARDRDETTCTECGAEEGPEPDEVESTSGALTATAFLSDDTLRLVAGLVLGAAAGLILVRFLKR